MEFVSRHFILLNAVVVTLLVISFLRMRRSSRQTSIKFRKSRDQYEQREVVIKRIVLDEDDPRLKRPDAPKSLNVMFNYNGHSWDAYEVLGVPAGSNYEVCFLSFEKLTKGMDTESRTFMLSALEAIRIQRQKDQL